jgi:hypothetical protein
VTFLLEASAATPAPLSSLCRFRLLIDRSIVSAKMGKGARPSCCLIIETFLLAVPAFAPRFEATRNPSRRSTNPLFRIHCCSRYAAVSLTRPMIDLIVLYSPVGSESSNHQC